MHVEVILILRIKFFRSPYGKVVKQWLPPNKEYRKFPFLYSLLFFQLGFLMQRAETKMKPFIIYHNYKTIIIFVIYSTLSDFHSHKNKVVMILASTNKAEKLKINKFLVLCWDRNERIKSKKILTLIGTWWKFEPTGLHRVILSLFLYSSSFLCASSKVMVGSSMNSDVPQNAEGP